MNTLDTLHAWRDDKGMNTLTDIARLVTMVTGATGTALLAGTPVLAFALTAVTVAVLIGLYELTHEV